MVVDVEIYNDLIGWWGELRFHESAQWDELSHVVCCPFWSSAAARGVRSLGAPDLCREMQR